MTFCGRVFYSLEVVTGKARLLMVETDTTMADGCFIVISRLIPASPENFCSSDPSFVSCLVHLVVVLIVSATDLPVDL